MDAEMRDHLARHRLQMLAEKADEVIRRDANVCDQCGDSIGYLSTVDLVIRSGNHKFCSEFCLEVFLDKQ